MTKDQCMRIGASKRMMILEEKDDIRSMYF
jgi:hypothetical protein